MLHTIIIVEYCLKFSAEDGALYKHFCWRDDKFLVTNYHYVAVMFSVLSDSLLLGS